jgi:hypothetical protein
MISRLILAKIKKPIDIIIPVLENGEAGNLVRFIRNESISVFYRLQTLPSAVWPLITLHLIPGCIENVVDSVVKQQN